MKLKPEEYKKMVHDATPKSKPIRDCSFAFLIGGAICCLGQLLLWAWGELAGLDETAAATMTSVSLIVLSGLLTGIGIYDNIARVAGAGTLVPITGFANAVVSPALEFKSEGYVLGTAAKMFQIAGPVIVYGTAASVIAGLLSEIWKAVGV